MRLMMIRRAIATRIVFTRAFIIEVYQHFIQTLDATMSAKMAEKMMETTNDTVLMS